MSLTTHTSARADVPAGLSIRPSDNSDADFAAVVAVHNAVYPEYPDTVAELRHGAATRPDYIKHRRFIAEREGAAIGAASYGQSAMMYHPRKFHIQIEVLPEQQGRGVGRALYDALLAGLAEHNPLSLRAEAREDQLRSVRFLQERGFAEDSRNWESRLDVAAFDPAPFAGQIARVEAQGIRLITLGELIASDPDHRRKLYELDCDATRDQPMPEPFTPPGQAVYDRWVFENPDLRPDGFFIAMDGERYVGLSSLFFSQADPDTLQVGFTGVASDYRRRGIALALKLRSVEYAQRAGVRQIRTGNASVNRPMLSINEALGFVKQPAWVNFLKTFDAE